MPCQNVSFSSTGGTQLGQSSRRWILVATVLGSSMEFIDGTVLNLALSSLQRSFAKSGTDVQWVIEGYALFLSTVDPSVAASAFGVPFSWV
jgi:hypothetical protein